MTGRKKTFDCGHKGAGQFCHRCALEEKVRAEKRAAKESWAESFAADPIDLRLFPRAVVHKARDVISKLAEGALWGTMGGKRLQYDRTLVSIPVTRDYRLICRTVDGALVLVRLVSHEEYNTAKPGE